MVSVTCLKQKEARTYAEGGQQEERSRKLIVSTPYLILPSLVLFHSIVLLGMRHIVTAAGWGNSTSYSDAGANAPPLAASARPRFAPRLILHVGPKKTGTTAIRFGLLQMKKVLWALAQDNVTILQGHDYCVFDRLMRRRLA